MRYNKEGYIKLLSKTFKNENEVLEEIINLKAILALPKGTEVFVSDVHGEYEPFIHVLNNGAGRVRSKIDLALSTSSKTKPLLESMSTCSSNVLKVFVFTY